MHSNEDDCFEESLRQQELKKQKKQAKQERLQRKKILIEEIKRAHTPPKTEPEVGSLDWAFFVLESNLFDTLGTIKKNYLRLAQQYHPDKNREENQGKMIDLNKAWEMIKKTLP